MSTWLFEAAARITLHLGCRLPNRLFMMANPLGPLFHRRGRRVGTALVLIDLVQAALLRRGVLDTRLGLGGRLAMDALDAAVVVGLSRFDAACGCGALLDTAPLVMETAYRDGVGAAIAAAAPAVVTVGTVRVVRGRPAGLGDLVFWPGVQIAAGRLCRLVERAQIQRRTNRETTRRQATGEQAFLHGRRAWTHTNLRLLDRLERFGLRILDIPGVQLASAHQLDNLAKTARVIPPPTPGQPAYLTALLQQYEEHRRTSHHITDRIHLTEPTNGQTLLTPHQTRRLWDALTILGVAGQLTIHTTHHTNRGLDTELTLHIASSHTTNNGPPIHTTLHLPTGTPAWRLEFVTLGLLVAGAYHLLVCLPWPAGVAVSWRVGATCALANAAAAALAEWRVRRHGSEAAPGAVLPGLGPALLMAAWGARRLGVRHTVAGISVFPGIWALNGIGFLVGFYLKRLDPRRKALLAAAVAAHLTVTWRGGYHPRSLSVFALDLLTWTATTTFAGARLAAALARLGSGVVAANERQTAAHAREQAAAGWAAQQREAELLHELAGRAIDQARPRTDQQRDRIREARRQHERLADDLRRAAPPTARPRD